MKAMVLRVSLASLFLLAACHHQSKPSLSGDQPVDVKDFIEMFPAAPLPYQMADTSVVRRAPDTSVLSRKLLEQFVPDTALTRVLGRGDRGKVYPLNQLKGPEGETYLLIKEIASDHRAIALLCFDKKNKYMAGMPVLVPDANPATQQSFSIDKRLTISRNILRRNADGTISDGKNVYLLNNDTHTFLLIMTDALDEQKVEVVNPIESLPKKSKFAADYVKDKWNLVSIRDNKKQGQINFFVHFEKKNNCSGELRGEATFVSPTVAVYHTSGDFCELKFTFSPTTVSIAEVQGCGSHRGIDCAFEGSFPKKKEAHKKETKKPVHKTTR